MERYDNVDGLKAIATVGILAGHLYVTTYSFGENTIFERVFVSFALYVILFMVLSGFGICAGYLERILCGKISMEEFFLKRYKKIFPYFAFVTFLGVLAEHTPKALAEGFTQLTLLFGLLPNNSNCFEVNGICWTLGTIFAFYVIFPFVAFLLANKRRACFSFACAIIIQIMCVFVFITDEYVVDGFLGRSNILYALPFFLSGGMLYIYRDSIKKYVIKSQWLFGIICIALTIFYFILPDKVSEYSIVDFKALVLFVSYGIYAIGAKSKLLNNRIMKVISRYNLEIYLTHMMVIKILGYLPFKNLLRDNIFSYVLMLVIVLVATVLIAKIFYYGLDVLKKVIKRKAT